MSGDQKGLRPRRFSLGWVDAYVGLALSAVLVARYYSHLGGIPFLRPCTFRALTGVPCPTCGFTRAFTRAGNLDFVGAWHVSPLGTALFLALAGFVVVGVSRIALRRPWPSLPKGRKWRRVGMWLLVAAVLSNWGYMIIRKFAVGDWA